MKRYFQTPTPIYYFFPAGFSSAPGGFKYPAAKPAGCAACCPPAAPVWLGDHPPRLWTRRTVSPPFVRGTVPPLGKQVLLWGRRNVPGWNGKTPLVGAASAAHLWWVKTRPTRNLPAQSLLSVLPASRPVPMSAGPSIKSPVTDMCSNFFKKAFKLPRIFS